MKLASLSCSYKQKTKRPEQTTIFNIIYIIRSHPSTVGWGVAGLGARSRAVPRSLTAPVLRIRGSLRSRSPRGRAAVRRHRAHRPQLEMSRCRAPSWRRYRDTLYVADGKAFALRRVICRPQRRGDAFHASYTGLIRRILRNESPPWCCGCMRHDERIASKAPLMIYR